MKKIYTFVLLAMCALSSFAVTVSDVAGTFKGTLNIGGTQYPNKVVYILPGVESNTITFVLPDFTYNNAPLGDIVLVNIPMSTSGMLTLDNRTLYIKAISERATISMINGLEEGGVTYNSIVSSSSAQVLLQIAAPSLPQPIFVLFNGSKVTTDNYAITNGGFEGNWSSGELNGWHSFGTATGSYSSFASNTDQFKQSTDKRPGTKGSYSALIQTKSVLGAKANGNCTNGRINAGSMTADDASGNYNFSDPSSSGYNTPFVGNPDSLVFWAKYIPADKNPSNSVNKARAHAVVTTNARYQDPEATSYANVKIADAAINYTATTSMGWQRIAVPFTYSSVNPSQAAYMLITFTSNMTPGGGSSYTEGGSIFGGGTFYPDYVYLDDVEMIYNHALTSLKLNGENIPFINGEAVTTRMYSDSEYELSATSNGKASQSFIGYDEQNNRVHIYVVGHNYSQAHTYNLYTLQMAEPIHDTWYEYAATICDNEQYTDELFTNLAEAGTYVDTIPNTQGGDSIVTLTLNVLPTFAAQESASMRMDETYEWRGLSFVTPLPGTYHDTVVLPTLFGCDSLFALTLTVNPIAYRFDETLTACQREQTTWHGKTLPTDAAGSITVYDSLQSVYGMDSVYALQLTVLPAFEQTETVYVNEVDMTWHGKTISGLPQSDEPYFFYDSLTAVNGCDSVMILRLYVSDVPVTYGSYEAVICQGEFVQYEGVRYREAFEGDIHVAETNMYGGDSIVHLTVTTLPSYTIDEYMTITEGDDATWEGWNLSMMPVGTMTLNATYYTEQDCDSTIVLHLTVQPVYTNLTDALLDAEHPVRKVLINGRLYIIRKEENTYDIVGRKVK